MVAAPPLSPLDLHAVPRSVPGPTRLRPADLLHVTDRTAHDVLEGRHDDVIPRGRSAAGRWYARVFGDDELDIWLIGWAPGHATRLHDHGGSLGALTVLSGALDEHRWDGERLRRRRLVAGDQAAFPLGWVHDVVWAPPAAGGSDAVDPRSETLSVHAYSPPLTVMSYYEVTPHRTLRRTATELTDAPEEP